MHNKPPPSTELVQRLQNGIANAIADFKAYDVPSLCERLGLEAGDEEEAYRSKRIYASKRLRGVRWPQLLRAAKLLLQERDDFELNEAVAHIEEIGTPAVTELTRKRIAGVLSLTPLVTEMEEIEFIRRLWPIGKMPPVYPSHRGEAKTFEDDFYQHAVRNPDWDNRDILEHLGFFTCSRGQLFKFLRAITDPLAQTADHQAALVERINEHLAHDGYALAIAGKMSGSPIYDVAMTPRGVPADAGISAVLAAFEPEGIHARWEMAMERRSTDPAGAITLARTLLEDVSKWVLDEAGVSYKDDGDLPTLYKKLAKTLKLAPDDHTEQIFKQILGSCQNIVESIGALRNKLSDAHSPGPKRARPLPRHAELAVNLAGTMATFLVSTWQARQQDPK